MTARLQRILGRRHAETAFPMGGPLTTFCAFYMVAFMLDAAETWEAPIAALVFLLAIAAVYLRGVTRATFAVFLAASSVYILIVQFPDPGNHNNLFLLCNLVLGAGMVHAARRPEKVRTGDALFDVVKPSLRISLSLVYLFAGFHKLNSGFFDPEAGCAQDFFARAWGLTPFPEISLGGAALVAFGASVVVWELGGGLMLWFRRTQPVMLAMSCAGHAFLALVGFFDFSSVAFALLLTFVPGAYWEVLRRGARARLGPFALNRLTVYVFANLGASAAAGLYFQVNGLTTSLHALQGLALNIGLLVFLWPILRQVVSRARVPWTGVAMWRAGTPRWAAALPLFIVFFGLNPYLGLRTAGTFTMFSNLQIQGERSNHLLLASNPLKVWGLQDDAVRVLEIDPRHADRRAQVLTGNLLPVVEFQKRIVDWGDEGLEGLWARYEYRGRVYETPDLVRDNPWRVDGHTLAHYLLDFRLIQPSGPVLCRW